MQVYTVKDKVAEIHNTPFFQISHAVALRAFRESCLDDRDGNLLNSNPQDFELYYIGTYDDETGLVTSLNTPELLASGEKFKRPQQG